MLSQSHTKKCRCLSLLGLHCIYSLSRSREIFFVYEKIGLKLKKIGRFFAHTIFFHLRLDKFLSTVTFLYDKPKVSIEIMWSKLTMEWPHCIFLAFDEHSIFDRLTGGLNFIPLFYDILMQQSIRAVICRLNDLCSCCYLRLL
jgi:hypothetical protein